MILRRVIEHVKTQNWTAVALDFVIVGVGVFIGIQVANWNETRQNRVAEGAYIQRLHDDVVHAIAASNRLRDRRLNHNQVVINALAVIRGAEGLVLSDDQCLWIAYSHDYSITSPSLPSFNELVSSGRLKIIGDPKLRRSLIALQQSLNVLDYWRSFGTRGQHDLPDKYPELIQVETYFDEAKGEVWARAACDTVGIRNNQRFLNNLSNNSDTLDGFIHDAVAPWAENLLKLHHRIDGILGVRHEGGQ